LVSGGYFSILFSPPFLTPEKENQVSMTKLSRTMSIVLALVVLGAVAAIIYMTTVAAPGDVFTEFYLLGPGKKAADYPEQLKVGEEASVIIGIGNQEQQIVSYRIEVKIDGVTADEVGPVSLKPREKFEQLFTFTPEAPGERQKVEFLLYKQGQTEVYKTLYLWIDVTA
jgi:uncharacterized membrane protein